MRLMILALVCALTFIATGSAFAEDPPQGWTGKLAIGGSLKEGNTSAVSLDLLGEMQREWDADRLKFAAYAGYGRAEGEKNKDQQSLTEDYRHYFSERLFLSGNSTQERNNIQSIDFRFLANVGPGVRVYELAPKSYFDVEAGIGYRYENFVGGFDRNDATARFALELAHLVNDALETRVNSSFLLPVTDTDSWIWRGLAYVAMPISENWLFTNALNLDYLNSPGPDPDGGLLDEFDLTYTVALEYRF